MWLVVETLVVWKFYIETKETPLEEIVKYFDGDGAIIGGASASEKVRHLADAMDGPVAHDTEKVGTIQTEAVL